MPWQSRGTGTVTKELAAQLGGLLTYSRGFLANVCVRLSAALQSNQRGLVKCKNVATKMPQISPFKLDLIYAPQEDVVKIFNNVWEPQWILAGTFGNMRNNKNESQIHGGDFIQQ